MMTDRSETAEQLLARHNSRTRTFAVMVAWAWGFLTENESRKILGVDLVDMRGHKLELLAVASALSDRYRADKTTVADDMAHEVIEAQRSNRRAP